MIILKIESRFSRVRRSRYHLHARVNGETTTCAIIGGARPMVLGLVARRGQVCSHPVGAGHRRLPRDFRGDTASTTMRLELDEPAVGTLCELAPASEVRTVKRAYEKRTKTR